MKMGLFSDSDETQDGQTVYKRNKGRSSSGEKALSPGLEGKERSEKENKVSPDEADCIVTPGSRRDTDERDSLILKISEEEVEDFRAKADEEGTRQVKSRKMELSKVDDEPNEESLSKKNVKDKVVKSDRESQAIKSLVDYQSDSDHSDEEENTDPKDEIARSSKFEGGQSSKAPQSDKARETVSNDQSDEILQPDRDEKVESDDQSQSRKLAQSDKEEEVESGDEGQSRKSPQSDKEEEVESGDEGQSRKSPQSDKEVESGDEGQSRDLPQSDKEVESGDEGQSRKQQSDKEEEVESDDEDQSREPPQSDNEGQSRNPPQSDKEEEVESDDEDQSREPPQSDKDDGAESHQSDEEVESDAHQPKSDKESLDVKENSAQEMETLSGEPLRETRAPGSEKSAHSPTPCSSDEDDVEVQSAQEAQSEGGAQSNSDDQSDADLKYGEGVNNEPQSDGEAQSASGSDRSPTPPIPSCSDEDDAKEPRPSSDEEVSKTEVPDPSLRREATTVDLFGELSSDDEAPPESRSDKELHAEIQNEIKVQPDDKETSESEQEPQAEAPPAIRIDANVPRFNSNLGEEIGFVKLPNFLSVEPRPFDPQLYEDEIDEDEVLDEEGRTRLKLKVENTIRWRMTYDESKNMKKESNARFIKWSDGSLSLQLGSEMFDVDKNSMANDFNHLFIRQGTGVQGQAVFKTRLTFRPHSTDSLTHRKMALSLAEKSTRTQKICILPSVGRNPETNKRALYKHEEKKLKALIKRQNTMVKFKDPTAHRRGLRPSYLEPDRNDSDSDDDDAISLAAIKNKYKKGDRPSIYSSEEESEKEKRLERAKRDRLEDDDSDMDYFDKKDTKKKKAIIEDSDEDD